MNNNLGVTAIIKTKRKEKEIMKPKIITIHQVKLKSSVKEVPMLHRISFEKICSKFLSCIELMFSGLVCVFYRKHLACKSELFVLLIFCNRESIICTYVLLTLTSQYVSV